MVPGARPGGILQPSVTGAATRLGGGVVHPSSRDTLRMKRIAEAAKQAKTQAGKVYVTRGGANISGCGLFIDYYYYYYYLFLVRRDVLETRCYHKMYEHVSLSVITFFLLLLLLLLLFLLLYKIRDLVPESGAYMNLLEFERKLDTTIMRKRLEIQETLKRPNQIKVRESCDLYPFSD